MIKWIKKIIREIKRYMNRTQCREEALAGLAWAILGTEEDHRRAMTKMRDAIIEYNKE